MEAVLPVKLSVSNLRQRVRVLARQLPGEDKRRGDQNPFCCLYGPMSASGRGEFLERLQSWPERVRVKAMAAVTCF